MKRRITIQKWKARGQIKWAVHRVDAGQRRRTFFHSQKAAEAEASLLRSQQATAGDVWLTLSASERQRLIQVHGEAQQRSVNLDDLLADWKRRPRFIGASPALGSVVAELVAAKVATGRSARYANSLSIPLHQFAKGRERVPMAASGSKMWRAFRTPRASITGRPSVPVCPRYSGSRPGVGTVLTIRVIGLSRSRSSRGLRPSDSRSKTRKWRPG
jgi:hypothetical protein